MPEVRAFPVTSVHGVLRRNRDIIDIEQMENDFEYDVAFSFNQQDEALALQLNDLLADQLKTFIYTEQQKELAGRDGQDAFSDVYGRRARIVVIFYRREWGATKWTTVEMTAIKTRAFDNGFDFTLFIPTETPPTTPAWLPKTRLYYGLERFGLAGAAGTIAQLVTEFGGRPHEETLVDRAARLARAAEFKRAQDQFSNSDYGTRAGNEAYAAFGAALKTQADAIKPHGIAVSVREARSYRIVSLGPIHLICHWESYYSNTIEDVSLQVTFNLGFPQGLPGFYGSPDGHRTLLTRNYQYRLVRPNVPAYVSSSEGARNFSPTQLADHLLKVLMDTHERNLSKRR